MHEDKNEIERGAAFYQACGTALLTNDPSAIAGFENDLVWLHAHIGLLADKILITPKLMRKYFEALEFVSNEFTDCTRPDKDPVKTLNVCMQSLYAIVRISAETRLLRAFTSECAKLIQKKHLVDMDEETLERITAESLAIIMDLQEKGTVKPSLLTEFFVCAESYLVLAQAFTSGDQPVVGSLTVLYDEQQARDVNDFLIGMWNAATQTHKNSQRRCLS